MEWFYNLSEQELIAAVKNLGLKEFVATQISTWILNKNVFDPSGWRNISKENRRILEKNLDFSLNNIVRIDKDPSGTRKFLIELPDGSRIESVLIREKNHFTFCISSQVGCALGCKFCATGNLGFKRDLSSGEIISQVLLLKKELGDYKGKINLVFMGMGEPLLNYENLKKALLLLTSGKGIGISPRRITVSTAGILKNLKKLEVDFPNVKISFSLNGSDNIQRQKVMPISKKESLDDIIEYFRQVKRKNRITFEYVIIAGVNDSLEDRDKILKLLRGIPSKINIIPYNPNDFAPFKTPSEKTIDEFAEYLAKKGMTVMVRWSKGRDIRSACGQLAGE
ncbi:MAG: 23S rRNA (adenine(2503)-C(2))-methyltransferase RlmN [Acidobacteriota bacterium]